MTFPSSGVWVPSVDETGRARMTSFDPNGQKFVRLEEYQAAVTQGQQISQARWFADSQWRNAVDELNQVVNDLTKLATESAEQVDALQQKIGKLFELTDYSTNNAQGCFCARCTSIRGVHTAIRAIIDPPVPTPVDGANPVIPIDGNFVPSEGSDDETYYDDDEE